MLRAIFIKRLLGSPKTDTFVYSKRLLQKFFYTTVIDWKRIEYHGNESAVPQATHKELLHRQLYTGYSLKRRSRDQTWPSRWPPYDCTFNTAADTSSANDTTAGILFRELNSKNLFEENLHEGLGS